MGCYKCRRPGYLSAMQISICEAVFQGRSDKWIYENIYHANMNDTYSVRSAANRLKALKKNPKFIEYYNSIVTEFRVHSYGKALNKLVSLIDDSNPWVGMQAANSVLSHTERAVVPESENTVTIKIEGMPTLGEPTEEALMSGPELVEAIESSVV